MVYFWYHFLHQSFQICKNNYNHNLYKGHTTMVDGMMSSAFAAAAAAHQDSLSRMTSMTNSIAPPQSHASHTAGQILGKYDLF